MKKFVFVLFCMFSLVGMSDPVGVLSSFSVDSFSVQWKEVFFDCLGVLGLVFAALFGHTFLLWLKRKICSALYDSAERGAKRDWDDLHK